jgi:thiamine-phosphate pyrophosphorylase
MGEQVLFRKSRISRSGLCSQPLSSTSFYSQFYSQKVLLYAITSRNLLPGTEPERQAALVELARKWAQGGVDYIQIREKDLPVLNLMALTRRIVKTVRAESPNTRVLLNGPAEFALPVGADGVHLPASISIRAADEAERLFQRLGRQAIVSRACHSLEEIREAPDVSLIVFAPVFEKVGEQDPRPGVGLSGLAAACRAAAPTPVIALGGITTRNAADCITAGAAGIAGIRLFLGDDWRTLAP